MPLGFYKKGGKVRPITRSKGSLFPSNPSQKYSKIVEIGTLEKAHESVRELKEEFDKAQTHEKKLKIFRVANNAANIAEVGSHNRRWSSHQRSEAREVSRIYRSAAEHFQRNLNA